MRCLVLTVLSLLVGPVLGQGYNIPFDPVGSSCIETTHTITTSGSASGAETLANSRCYATKLTPGTTGTVQDVHLFVQQLASVNWVAGVWDDNGSGTAPAALVAWSNVTTAGGSGIATEQTVMTVNCFSDCVTTTNIIWEGYCVGADYANLLFVTDTTGTSSQSGTIGDYSNPGTWSDDINGLSKALKGEVTFCD